MAASHSEDSQQPSNDVYPKIGLVLSGGGARGFAHIGALRVLEELGIPVDYVAGTSMGSIIGGLYAAGYSVEELEKVITEVDWDEVFSDTPPRELWSFLKKRQSSKYLFGLGFTQKGFSLPTGVTKGQKISTLFSFLTMPVSGIEHFDDLPIPYRAVAADIETGEEVVLDHGTLAEAMRASMSVPGVFTPVEIDGHLLVDGGIVKNLPVDVAQAMGADIVIAVDVSSGLASREELGNPFAILNQMIGVQMMRTTLEQRKLADIMILTDLENYTSADFNKGIELAALGEKSTRKHLQELQALVEKIRTTRPLARAVPHSLLAQFQDIYLEDVVVQGETPRYKETSIHNYLRQEENMPLDPEMIERTVSAIFSTGDYESVKFTLIPGTTENARILQLQLQEKPFNPHLLRFGMYYEARQGDEEPDKLVFLLNATFNDLTGPGSFWSTDLQFVNATKLRTQYFQPLGKVLFLLPELYDDSDFQVVYENKESVARYDVSETGGLLQIGFLHQRAGLVTIGYGLEKADANPTSDVDPARFPRFDDTVSSILVRSSIDRLDKFPFPHSGGLFELEYQRASKQLGGNVDFHKFSVEYWKYFGLAERHTLGCHLLAGTDFQSELQSYKNFLLGGRDSFVGYKVEEIRGANIGIGGVEYHYQLGELPTPLGGNIYAILIGNVGNAWRTLDHMTDDFGLRYGGSIGLGIDSLLGPIMADFSIGDGGRQVLYLNFGFKF